MSAVPATCPVGVPVFPDSVPGTADSPGRRTCSLVAAPAFTVTAVLVDAVNGDEPAWSVAVNVGVPAAFTVTGKVPVPDESAAAAGSMAVTDVDVIATSGVADDTTFQWSSTAFTLIEIESPAVAAVGVPVFPDTVPGAAVSPGISTCSFVALAGFTVTPALVPGDTLGVPETRVAVKVGLSFAFTVAVNVPTPDTSAASLGSTADDDDDVMPTVGFADVTRFQLSSTALTVIDTMLPAVTAVGTPVFPVTVPGAAVSPGSSTCSFVAAPALTVTEPVVCVVSGDDDA